MNRAPLAKYSKLLQPGTLSGQIGVKLNTNPLVWRQAAPDLDVFNSLGVIGPQMSLSMWPAPYLHIMRGLRARQLSLSEPPILQQAIIANALELLLALSPDLVNLLES